jgi:hypothetical protein
MAAAPRSAMLTGRLAVLAALVFVAALQIHRLDDPDTWWHLAAGRQIATTGTIPHTDSFSYTAGDAPWMNRQWLFDVTLYETWRLLGDAGPALAAGAGFVAAFGCLLALARRELPDWAAALAVGVAALAAVERFTVRPEAATFLFFAAYCLLLARPVGWRRVAVLVGLQVVWANTHALSILGLLPVGAALAAAVVGRRPDRAPLAVATIGLALAEAATPYGLPGALFPLRLLSDISGTRRISYTIVEHRPTLASLGMLSPAALWALAALVVAAAVAVVPAVRRRLVAPLLVAAGAVGLGLLARRNVALVGFGVVPLVAIVAGPGVRRLGARTHAVAGVLVGACLLTLTASVVHGGFYERAHLSRAFGLGSSEVLFPRAAVRYLLRTAPGACLFNDDLMGGLVTWESDGKMRVFFDGRLQLYPRAIYAAYQDVLDDPGRFPALAARWGFDAVLLNHPSPGRLELAARIARLPGWRIAYLDAGGIVLLADGGRGEPAGIRGPVMAARTEGVADAFEAVAAPLRGGWEEATAWYQRGRAIHFLYGPPGYRLAHADFAEALRWRPDFEAARIGLEVTAGS